MTGDLLGACAQVPVWDGSTGALINYMRDKHPTEYKKMVERGDITMSVTLCTAQPPMQGSKRARAAPFYPRLPVEGKGEGCPVWGKGAGEGSARGARCSRRRAAQPSIDPPL